MIKEVKKALEEKKVFIGTSSTLKNLKKGKVNKVFLSSNCPKKVKGEIEKYCKLGKINVVELEYPNDELGALCKKPFSISVVSLHA